MGSPQAIWETVPSSGSSVGLDGSQFKVGSYYAPPRVGSAGAADPGTAAGRMFAFLFPVNYPTTFDRMGFYLNAPYGAGSILRLGAYSVLPNNRMQPNTLILDAGTFDCTAAAGWKENVINALFPPGMYLLVALSLSGWTVGTGSMIRVQQIISEGIGDNTVGNANPGWVPNGVPDNFPNPGPTLTPANSNAPLIKLRAA